MQITMDPARDVIMQGEMEPNDRHAGPAGCAVVP